LTHSALRWGGGPRSIRVDVTRDERLLLPPVSQHLIHPYSDGGPIVVTKLACYPLEEVLAEKLRAVGGQRRFAISRDLYDIHQLIKAGVSLPTVARLLPAKFEAKGLDLTSFNIASLEARRKEFEQDWNLRLSYLIPALDVDFTATWTSTLKAIKATRNIPAPDAA
jgi:predicted nucleotidyltransferase component of viral defense system